MQFPPVPVIPDSPYKNLSLLILSLWGFLFGVLSLRFIYSSHCPFESPLRPLLLHQDFFSKSPREVPFWLSLELALPKLALRKLACVTHALPNLMSFLIMPGPSNWTGKCASGTSQSPIKINSSASEYKSFSAWNLYNFGNTPSVNFTGTNNGHTLKISFPKFTYFVNGGGLSGNYTTAQFHLHWGTKDTQGSEHWLDDKQYAAEVCAKIICYPLIAHARYIK